MTTDEDEFTRKLATANHAKGIANSAYAAATHIHALIQSGMKVPDILRAVWAKLAPRESARIAEDALVDGFAPLLEFLVPMMSDDGPPGAGHIRKGISAVRSMLGDIGSEFSSTLDAMESAANRIEKLAPPRVVEATIRRLLAEATSPLPDQAPAIQGGVVLFGVPMMFEGALSETPEGGLRLLSPVVQPGQRPPRPGERVEMLEQFFGYEDVAVFAVRRQVHLDKTRIIQTS